MVFIKHIGQSRTSGELHPAEWKPEQYRTAGIALAGIQVDPDHRAKLKPKIVDAPDGQMGEPPLQQDGNLQISQIEHIAVITDMVFGSM